MRISAKSDYAVRAAVVLAVESEREATTAEAIARSQDIPLKFLLNILNDLKRARIVASHRGSHGGYHLARPPDKISVADVIRAIEGPLASVHEIPRRGLPIRLPPNPSSRSGSPFGQACAACSRGDHRRRCERQAAQCRDDFERHAGGLVRPGLSKSPGRPYGLSH